MKKDFEYYIFTIEDFLGIKLLNYQKDILKRIYNGKKSIFIPSRGAGLRILNEAIQIMTFLMEEIE